MDIARASNGPILRRRLYVAVPVLLLAIAGLAFVILPAMPTVETDTLWIDEVRRGPLVRSVRGMGKLTPERSRLVTAQSAGIVEALYVFPGTLVDADTVILRLINHQLEQDLANAEFSLAMREAELANQRVLLKSELLLMQADLQELEASFVHAEREVSVNERLYTQNMLAETTLEQSRLKVEQLRRRVTLERQRIEYQREAHEAQLDSLRLDVKRLNTIGQGLSQRVAGLDVRAGIDGTLQRLPVDVGQQVGMGDMLAQVADPHTLKAVIEIPETRARDVKAGLEAVIDTRHGRVAGQVVRVDPAVTQGVVKVDVQLAGDYPSGARADLTVEGIVELERLTETVFITRPPEAREGAKLSLFRLAADSDLAVRTSVHFGASSASQIEVIEGLVPGDRVILSDLTRWDDFTQIRIQ